MPTAARSCPLLEQFAAGQGGAFGVRAAATSP